MPTIGVIHGNEMKAQISASSAATTDMMVGPYYVSKKLGSGSYASVRLGVHHATGANVALKMISKGTARAAKEGSARGDILRRVQHEVAMMQRLNGHSNIVQLLGFSETPRFYVIVMEYAGGSDLYRQLKREGDNSPKWLSGGVGVRADDGMMERPFRWFCQLVFAVEHCHLNGVAHRDIKV